MFSSQLRTLRQSVGARLTLWFGLVFSACLLLVLLVSYYLLSQSLKEKDRELTLAKWKEYSEAIASEGLESLQHKVAEDYATPGATPFVVGLEDEGRLLLLRTPKTLKGFGRRDLEPIFRRRSEEREWLRITLPETDHTIEALVAPFDVHTTLLVGKSTQDRERTLHEFRRILLSVIIPVSFLGFLAGFVLSRRALRPIRDLSSTAKAIYAGDMKARVPLGGSADELDELGKLFNQMLERISVLVQGMKDSLDNVAHDLRTPIARFRGLAEAGLSAEDPAAQREALCECIESSDDILRLLNALMDQSSIEAGTFRLKLETLDFSQLTRETADLFKFLAEEKRVDFELDVPGGIWVRADRTRLSQALANLFDNALKYTEPGGRIVARIAVENGKAEFRIDDTGAGIPPDELPRVWERLYRGDKSRSQRGMGLGLSIVRTTVQAHGGQVGVESSVGKGSRFTVTLPVESAN